MLADNLESWAKRERQEGVQEGINEGRIETLRKLITLKFNDIPRWAEQRLEQASQAELDEWVEHILSADSLEALFQR